MSAGPVPAVWFPAVRAGTGTDVFTERLCAGLNRRGIRAEITWLPLRAEYAPWTVRVPKPPAWANVVHVNSWLHPRFLPKGLPIVVTVHHAIHDPALDPYKGLARTLYHRWWIRLVERRTLHHADVVVAVSKFAADIARKYVLDRPMRVIYNGVDTNVFRPGGRERKPGEPFRLLYVGGWKKLKGVDLLAPIMRDLGDGFELVYTGGKAANRDKAGMPPNMRDIGRLDGEVAVAEAMQDADALVFPSRSEGFGLVVAEAMACGLPVVATRGSSLTEVLEDGEAGILCQQDNIKAFESAARKLATDARLVTGMSRAALDCVRGGFFIERTSDAYFRLYARYAGEQDIDSRLTRVMIRG